MLSRIVWLCEQGRPYRGPLLGSGLGSLITVIAGSLLDYSYRGINPLSDFTILIALLISLFFLTWWSLGTDRIYKKLAQKMVRSRFKNPKTGVICPTLSDAEIKDLLRSTAYTPEMWFDCLRSENFDVEKTSDLTFKDHFSIVFNPFGELYLEDDTMNLRTFQNIKEYIRKGGVFVSTAGLAFYYMWNPKRKIEGLTGPVMQTYIGSSVTKPTSSNTYESSIALQPVVMPDDSSLIDTWLYRNFGIRTTLGGKRTLKATAVNSFNGIVGENVDVQEFRSALRCENPECHLIPIIRSEYVYQPTGRKHECFPIAAVKYGLGYLILVGMVLKDDRDLSLVTRAIKKVIQRLSEKGFLEEHRLS
jgi:hypothetical protein